MVVEMDTTVSGRTLRIMSVKSGCLLDIRWTGIWGPFK